MTKTRILATIGPASSEPTVMMELHEAGMDVARLNGAHQTLEWHAQRLKFLREVLPQTPVMLDLPGRKIRVRGVGHGRRFQEGEEVGFTVQAGDPDPTKVCLARPDLSGKILPGMELRVDDGRLCFEVVAAHNGDLLCRAKGEGVILEGKGVSVPILPESREGLTERDQALMELAADLGVDFVALSYVDRPEQVLAAKEKLKGSATDVIAKIETREGLEAVDGIIEAADAVLVDRGDLAAETGCEEVAIHQKQILAKAGRAGKPAIVATELLHSMILVPYPTKAEVSDVSNAVLDGATALLLSGETAVGRYPVEAVRMAKRIAGAVENASGRLPFPSEASRSSIPMAMGEAIAHLCGRLAVTKIVAITHTGYAARAVAAFRPSQPILAVTDSPSTARKLNVLPGTEGVWVDIPFDRTSTDHIARCLKILWERGKLSDEDMVLVTAVGYPNQGNRMNLIQTHRVLDLRTALAWDSV